MRRLFLVVVACWPGIALAVSPGWFDQGAKEVTITSAVEVPLYRGEARHFLPTVLVSVPGEGEEAKPKEAFAGLNFFYFRTTIGEPLAKQWGLKIKEEKSRGTKVKRTVIEELHIGDLVLKGIQAKVVKGQTLELGLASIEEMAVAILPSSGTVRFVPASNAAGLVKGVGTPQPVLVEEFKPVHVHGQKLRWRGAAYAVAGSVEGQEGSLLINTGGHQGFVTDALAVEETTRWGTGTLSRPSIKIGDALLEPTWLDTFYSLDLDQIGRLARVPYDSLYHADIAFSPSEKIFSIARADDVKWSDSAAKELAMAKAKFDDKPDEKEDAEGEKGADSEEEAEEEDHSKGNPGDKKEGGRLASYAGALNAAGQVAETVALREQAIEHAGDRCQPYADLGWALLHAGSPEAAVDNFKRADELWLRWDTQDLEIRQAVETNSKDKKKKKKQAAEATFNLIQSGNCHRAKTGLAKAYLALEDHESLEALAKDYDGLDPAVQRLYGLSLITQGRYEEAGGPIREAMNNKTGQKEDDRYALGMLQVRSGQMELAQQQLDWLLGLGSGDLYWLYNEINLGRLIGGDEGARGAIQAELERDPYALVVHLVHAWLLSDLGKTEELQEALKTASTLFEKRLMQKASDRQTKALGALLMALQGNNAAAQTALGNLPAGSWTPDETLVKLLVASLSGDEAVAEKMRTKKRRSHPELLVFWDF